MRTVLMQLTLNNADGFPGEVETCVEQKSEGKCEGFVPLVPVEGCQETDPRRNWCHFRFVCVCSCLINLIKMLGRTPEDMWSQDPSLSKKTLWCDQKDGRFHYKESQLWLYIILLFQ